eukprot:1153188-Pelagomonas_calceolata.AAC.1
MLASIIDAPRRMPSHPQAPTIPETCKVALLDPQEPGIIKALRESSEALKAAKVFIFVRRGGPNYLEGLDMMRALGSEIGVPIEVGKVFCKCLGGVRPRVIHDRHLRQCHRADQGRQVLKRTWLLAPGWPQLGIELRTQMRLTLSVSIYMRRRYVDCKFHGLPTCFEGMDKKFICERHVHLVR